MLVSRIGHGHDNRAQIQSRISFDRHVEQRKQPETQQQHGGQRNGDGISRHVFERGARRRGATPVPEDLFGVCGVCGLLGEEAIEFALELVVAEYFVQVFAGLHVFQHGMLMAVLGE